MSAFVHVAPPTYVTAPTFQPHRFGLFSVSNMVERPERYWETGVQFEPISCWPVSGVSGVCFDPDAREEMPHGWPLQVFQSGVDTVTALPFAVYGWYDCSGMSRPLQEAEDRARAHLAAGEEREVEWSIADGAFDNVPNATDAVDLGGPFPMETAFGLLEGHLGTNYGGPGVIHMARSLASTGKRLALFDRQGARLETALGNYVAAGSGYDMNGWGLTGGDTATLWVTSVPTIRRSEVWVNPDPEFRPQRTNNDLTIFAWRVYLVAWECVSAKVTVELPEGTPSMFPLTVDTAGTGSGVVTVSTHPSRTGLYEAGTEVELTAHPDAGSGLGTPLWSGDVDVANENDNPLTVTMDQARAITATFEEL